MAEATLLISSRNYSSWSLRGFLLARMSGLPFREQSVAALTEAQIERYEGLAQRRGLSWACD